MDKIPLDNNLVLTTSLISPTCLLGLASSMATHKVVICLNLKMMSQKIVHTGTLLPFSCHDKGLLRGSVFLHPFAATSVRTLNVVNTLTYIIFLYNSTNASSHLTSHLKLTFSPFNLCRGDAIFEKCLMKQDYSSQAPRKLNKGYLWQILKTCTACPFLVLASIPPDTGFLSTKPLHQTFSYPNKQLDSLSFRFTFLNN